MKKTTLLFIFILAVFMLISCEKKGEIQMYEVDQDTIIYDKITQTHKYSDVVEFINNNKGLQEFMENFNVEYIKKFHEITYTVLNTDKGFIVVAYNENQTYNSMVIVKFSPDENEENINNLNCGMLLSDAINADPNGYFGFLYHSWSGFPKTSTHFFKNGECFIIEYNDEEIIVNILTFTI